MIHQGLQLGVIAFGEDAEPEPINLGEETLAVELRFGPYVAQALMQLVLIMLVLV